MKKLISAILFGVLLSACASMRTFNDPNVSIYLGRFDNSSYYFYLDKKGNFYMLDEDGDCEIGQCRISQDTLYCYPRINNYSKDRNFVRDTASLFYNDSTPPNLFQPVYSVKYFIKDNRLYVLSETESNSKIDFSMPFYSDDAFFEKIEIKDDPKYRKEVFHAPL